MQMKDGPNRLSAEISHHENSTEQNSPSTFAVASPNSSNFERSSSLKSEEFNTVTPQDELHLRNEIVELLNLGLGDFGSIKS